MVLGQKAHTAGDTTRYTVNYSRWLEDGVSLVSPSTVVLSAATPVPDITISGVSVLAEHNRVAFVLAGGSVNETFTLDIQSMDTRGEVKNDSLQFVCIAP